MSALGLVFYKLLNYWVVILNNTNTVTVCHILRPKYTGGVHLVINNVLVVLAAAAWTSILKLDPTK